MRSGWEVVPFEYWPPLAAWAKHFSYYTSTAHCDISPIMCTGIFGFTVHPFNVTLTLTSASVTTQLDNTCVWLFKTNLFSLTRMFWIRVFPTALGNFKWMLTLTRVTWVYLSQELRPSESEATKMLREWSWNDLSYWTNSSSNHQ